MPQAVGFPALTIRELPAVGRGAVAGIDVISVFETLRAGSYPWLLDSGGAPGAPSAQLARYSFAGADPYLVVRCYGNRCEFSRLREVASNTQFEDEVVIGDPLEVMRDLMPDPASFAGLVEALPQAPPFLGGAVSCLGYELGESCEPVHLNNRDDFGLADLVLLLVDRLLVVDHLDGRSYAVGLGFGDDAPDAQRRSDEAASAIEEAVATTLDRKTLGLKTLDREERAGRSVNLNRCPVRLPDRNQILASSIPRGARASLDESEYRSAVREIREEITRGNVYQANLTRRIDLSCNSDTEQAGKILSDRDRAWNLYRAMRRLTPAPFAAYIELPEVTIASSSPERYLSLSRERMVESRPIKGTRRRGICASEDSQLAKELAESEKDRAENLMIVDLVRNDLGRVCEVGSIEVPELMSIEAYATVFQMVSTVRGRLLADCDRSDLIRASYPPGSMTGAPKIAAMKIIDRLENVRRGFYSGAIGYMDIAGGLDLSVVIRTLLVRDGKIHIHGGGAVVSDSDPIEEYLESVDKVRALLAAVEYVG
jgi:para-aminobenzoate synthetase component 1